jgi:hypothetical protein
MEIAITNNMYVLSVSYQQFWNCTVKSFAIGHMYMHSFLLRMINAMVSQNAHLSSWDSLYTWIQLSRIGPAAF